MGYIEKGRAGTLTKIILWLIVLSFVLAIFVQWGSQNADISLGGSAPFTVAGRGIDPREFELNDAFYQFLRDRLAITANMEDFYVWNAAAVQIGSRVGGGMLQLFTSSQDDSTQRFAATIAMMIGDTVLAEEAARAGIRVTDKDVARALAEVYKDPDGKFIGTEAVERDLLMYNVGADAEPRFKELIKRHLMARHYVTSLYAAVRAGLKTQARQIFEAQTRTAEFSFARFDANAYMAQLNYTDADLEKYLADHPGEFVIADMMLLDKALYAAGLQIGDAEISRYYDENKEAEYTAAESRDVRRILVKLAQDADEAAVTAAQEKIAQIYTQLARPGEEFATVARKYSEDPSVQTEEGMIMGLTRDGARDQAFVDAAFALTNEGDYNKIATRTADGLEIIQLVKKNPGSVQPLEEVKAEIREELAQQRADAEAATRADELRSQSIGGNWDNLAQQAWVSVQRSVCAIQGESDIFLLKAGLAGAGAPSDISALFSTPEKETTSVMQVGDNFAFFRIVAKGSNLSAHFADLKPAVGKRYTSVNSTALAKAAADQFAGAAHGESPYEAFLAAATAQNVTLQDASVNKYEGVFTYGADLLKKIFDAGAGTVIGPIERDRSFYVAFVKNISPVDEALFAQQEADLRMQLLSSWMQGQPNIYQFMNIVDSSFAELMEAQIAHLVSRTQFSFNRDVVIAMFGLQTQPTQASE